MNERQNQNTDIAIEDTAPLITLPPEAAHKDAESERVLQLLYALHSSLDIKTIIQQFAQGIHQQIICDGISYRYESIHTAVTIGKMERHKIVYTLSPNERDLGTLTFSRRTPFTEEETTQVENLLCFLLNPLNNAIDHLHALQSALRDPLTQLANRAALDTALHRDIELAKRHQASSSILALDLDHFKQVNDNYGHGGGDTLLQCFAEHLRQAVRESDMVFRTGGEEFIILLSKTDTNGAINLADRIRKSVANLQCPYKDQTIHITVSIGVATYISGDNNATLLEKADRALYRAKSEGRNRVAI